MSVRVFYVRHITSPSMWIVEDDGGYHIRFKSKLSGATISGFGTKRFALKAIKDAYGSNVIVSKQGGK